ncbi:MAG: glycogen synthase GlgA [Deltaproteobacteria bacterium]|nr:glycogen synthase GlgA [Deltaproteobacteria bacterium]
MSDPLRILFVASEVGPFARTGGLGDVIGALPKALAALGHDVRVVMPLYRQVRDGAFPLTSLLPDLQVPDTAGNRTAQVWQGFLPTQEDTAPAVPVYFIEQNEYFSRPGLYGDDSGDYPDNAARFTFFCRAALLLALRLEWFPQVFHCHDWQSALIPAYLRVFPWLDERLSAAATVYTIHNMAYQGTFPAWTFPVTGLPLSLFQPAGVEFLGYVNFMKAGLLFADALTTVSPTYAEEICTPEFGSGLDGVLRSRRDALTGILNGADYSVWSPEHDPLIPTHYDETDLAGKMVCKRALLQTCHLPEDVDTPLIGMISRLVDQKGFDLVAAALERLLAMDVRFVVLGSGAQPYEELLTTLSARHPQKFAVRLGFDNALAHQIEAGSDCFLMPSRYEPCGLNQIYSLRYGTIPIVRSTGGLKDTITPFNAATGEGTGFVFHEASGDALVSAVTEALRTFADRSAWRQLTRNAMARDFSWDRSAAHYVQLYTQTIAAKRAGGTIRPTAL